MRTKLNAATYCDDDIFTSSIILQTAEELNFKQLIR